MAEYIYPLATLVLDFFCLILCIRYAASRKGLVWLIPILLSLMLLMGSVICLLAAASNVSGPAITEIASYLSIFLFVISAIWILVVIGFGQRMKSKLNEAAVYEAQFLSRRIKEDLAPDPDPRPSARDSVTKTNGLATESVADYYSEGPVRTLRPKRTAR